jgi:hypothetical protein
VATSESGPIFKEILQFQTPGWVCSTSRGTEQLNKFGFLTHFDWPRPWLAKPNAVLTNKLAAGFWPAAIVDYSALGGLAPSPDVATTLFKARAADRRPGLAQRQISKNQLRSLSTDCGSEFACANIAVPVCTRMFSFAYCVLSVATSTSVIWLLADERLLFSVESWLL